MKKIIALSIVMLALTGCSESEVKKETESVFKSEYKELINEDLNDTVKAEVNSLQNEFYNVIVEPLNLKGSNVDITKIDGYSEVMYKLNRLKQETEYEFKEVKIEDNKAKVLLKTKYPEVGEKIVKSISESMEKASLKMHSGENLTKEQYLESVLKNLNEDLDGEKFKKLTNENVEISLEKDKKWKVSSLNKDALQSLSLNLEKQKGVLLKKAEETEKNVFFIETEANLRNIFNEVKKMVSKGEVSYKKMNTKNVSKKLNKSTGLTSEVVDKPGNKENVYYISRSGKNSLSVVVFRNGEKYKFVDKLK